MNIKANDQPQEGRIERVAFQNFMALRDVELRLSPITVLVGPNASGKTSILRGLYYLTQIAEIPEEAENFFEEEALDPATLISRNEGSFQLLLEGSWGVPGSLSISVQRTTSEYCSYTVTPNWEAPTQNTKRHPLAEVLLPSYFFHFDTALLAAPSYSDSPTPHVAQNGEGLAATLAEMALTRPDAFQSLQDAMREVIPVVKKVRLERAKVIREETEVISATGAPFSRKVEREFWGYKIVLDIEGGTSVPAELASEGTLLVLGLLTALWSADFPKLILLDDLERGLHPKALKNLVAQLRAIMRQNPQLQLFVTSHSPYLLDHFQPEEIRISTLNPDGSALWASMTEHPEFDKWKDLMSPGEFWSHIGEEWVASQKGGADE